jgi:hypothetical protein
MRQESLKEKLSFNKIKLSNEKKQLYINLKHLLINNLMKVLLPCFNRAESKFQIKLN